MIARERRETIADHKFMKTISFLAAADSDAFGSSEANVLQNVIKDPSTKIHSRNLSIFFSIISVSANDFHFSAFQFAFFPLESERTSTQPNDFEWRLLFKPANEMKLFDFETETICRRRATTGRLDCEAGRGMRTNEINWIFLIDGFETRCAAAVSQ